MLSFIISWLLLLVPITGLTSINYNIATSSQQNLADSTNTIDQIPWLGLNLTSTVFNDFNYTTGALEVLGSLLASQNISLVYFDVYNISKNVSLSRESSITVQDLLLTINSSIAEGADYVQMVINNHNASSSSLEQSLNSTFGSQLSYISSTDNPTLSSFTSAGKMLVVSYWDKVYTVFNESLLIDSRASYNTYNSIPWKLISTYTYESTSVQSYLRSGCSVILNNLLSGTNYSDLGQLSWAWNLTQPLSKKKAKTLALHGEYPFKIQSDDTINNIEFSCVIMNGSNWFVDDCYNQYQVACQSISDPLDWKFGSKSSFFYASDNCPDNYTFSYPKTPLIQSYLSSFLPSNPVWIMVNSIDMDQCFVAGGPNAICAHSKRNNKKQFVSRSVAMSIVIAFLSLLIMFISAQKVTVQKNRKYWKNFVKDFKDEYEGVSL